MNDFQSISSDLLTTFNDLVYYDEPHKYFLGKQDLISDGLSGASSEALKVMRDQI